MQIESCHPEEIKLYGSKKTYRKLGAGCVWEKNGYFKLDAIDLYGNHIITFGDTREEAIDNLHDRIDSLRGK